MTFEEALTEMRAGYRVQRAHRSWPFDHFAHYFIARGGEDVGLSNYYGEWSTISLRGPDLMATDWCRVQADDDEWRARNARLATRPVRQPDDGEGRPR